MIRRTPVSCALIVTGHAPSPCAYLHHMLITYIPGITYVWNAAARYVLHAYVHTGYYRHTGQRPSPAHHDAPHSARPPRGPGDDLKSTTSHSRIARSPDSQPARARNPEPSRGSGGRRESTEWVHSGVASSVSSKPAQQDLHAFVWLAAAFQRELSLERAVVGWPAHASSAAF